MALVRFIVEGVAVVPRVTVAKEMQHGRLVTIPIQDLPACEIGLVKSKDIHRPLAAAAFLHLLRISIAQGKR